MALPEVLTRILDNGLEFVYGLEPYVTPTVVLGKHALLLLICKNARGV